MSSGVPRRFSGAWQEEVVTTLQREVPQFFKGTSNVRLAMDHDLVPIGTMAHEYLQSYQALDDVRLRQFQKAALEDWVQEYRGDLGVALTDVVGMDAFLADFDLYFAKLFDGLRHDSGDPVAWGEKALAHYEKLRIDPHTKRLVFSDGLDIPMLAEKPDAQVLYWVGCAGSFDDKNKKVMGKTMAEHLRFADHGVPVTVELVEHLGDVQIVYARAAGQSEPLAIKLGSDSPAPASGSRAWLAIDTAQCHLFGPDGQAIRHSQH